MTIKLDLHTAHNGEFLAATLRAVLQYQAQGAVAATALTDNSTGSAGTLAAAAEDVTNTADGGTTLAGKASTETALGTVKNALATLFAKANAAATTLGLDTVTYSGGGTSGGNTLGAVTQSVTAGTTGAQATEWNAIVADINAAFYVLGALVNRLATATGHDKLALTGVAGYTYGSTVAAISTDTGTAADPGVTKVAADAALDVFANNAATVAAKVNEVVGGVGTLKAVAV